jgi:hypothetical protein
MKTSTTHSYCEDDATNDILNIDANKNESYLIDGDSHCRKRIPQVVDNEDDCESLSDNDDYESESERQIGDGNDENDLFLKVCEAKTGTTV